MDFLRSAYDVPMCFRDGDAPLQVRWRRALPVAKVFPVAHKFFSANWDGRFTPGGGIGEQPGPRPWRNGAVGENPSGQVIGCQPTRWWILGLDPGELGPTFDHNCQVPCCLEANPEYWNGSLVPDRIKLTTYANPLLIPTIDGFTCVLKRTPGRSEWHFEALNPSIWFYWIQADLNRTGPNPGDWSLRVSFRTILFNLPDNFAVPFTWTSSPFHMEFAFPAFQTAYWSSLVFMNLDPL